MDDNADLHDWELLHGPDFTDNYACVVVLDEPPSNFAIKDDYFAFDSGSIQRLQSEESDEGEIDSDNPSCPDSDSNAGLESSKERLGFLWDESSDRQRLEASVMEMGSEKSVSGCGREEEGSDRSDLREMMEIGGDAGINPSCPDSDSNAGLESSKERLGFLSDESSDRQRLEASVMEMGSEKSDSGCGREEEGSDRSDLQEMTEIGGDAGISPSCPDSDSNAGFEPSEEHLGFRIQISGGFLSDESSDRQISLDYSECMELGRLQASAMEMGSEKSDSGCGREGEGSDISDLMTEIGGDAGINPSCPDSDSNAGLEFSKECLGFLSDESSDRQRLEDSVMEMESEESDRSDAAINEGEKREMNSGDFLSDKSDGRRSLGDSEHVELGILEDSVMEMGSEESDRSDTEIGGDAAINEGEKREKTWWNVPLGLLKYCLVGMRPVWSLSIAAAVVGLVMLWRKLYRMKQKSRIIPLKLAIDEKKTSQFAARSARLNAAFSVVRRMPAIRPSLQEGVATQWAALPLR